MYATLESVKLGRITRCCDIWYPRRKFVAVELSIALEICLSTQRKVRDRLVVTAETMITNLGRSKLPLRDAIQKNHEYKLRQKRSPLPPPLTTTLICVNHTNHPDLTVCPSPFLISRSFASISCNRSLCVMICCCKSWVSLRCRDNTEFVRAITRRIG